ncbi:Interferon-induced, double-stranded RNA-activated protein kinase [Folsomia candida]|uniref:Interferon-induced, double-stranded RNA-activated protein kinase n=1 Tax=Folsomia candida TaxID=158441 RepID=A0A226DFF8_FOLCA|nr:Interferon-induced, double-stranded RNA-activated protein kinase [Folsomia candida]
MENASQFYSKLLQEFEILQWDPDNEGAFGTVCKVKERVKQNSNPTVIKIIEACNKTDFSVNYTKNQFNYTKYAKREITILAKLDHPNILKILEGWQEHVPCGFRGYPKKKTPVKGSEGVYIIRTEWCDQGSVSKWLKSAWRCEADGYKIAYQIASGLNFLHEQKIIHRDLKPANILLKTEGVKVLVVKISDFGLATELRTKMTSRVGTKSYRSPELNKHGGIKYSAKADIFSFGVILFKILVRCKFDSELEQEFSSMMHEGVKEVNDLETWKQKWKLASKDSDLISSMISQNPERRPACAEIISKLQEIPDITNGIVPFDTKPEHFVYEGPELDLNCFTISKCEILTLLTLNNVSVQISELMKCLENCVNLKYLDLSISQRESGTEKDLGKDLPYRPVNLKHLTNFKLHHLNKLCNSDSLTNITEISTDILRNLLFFEKKQQPKKLVLSILTLDECLISRDFVDKYDQILEVEVLTIISCQSGGEHCRNFDLVCSVLKTTWDVIRLKPFYWNCTNREFGKSLIEEYFKDVPRGCEMIEIIGNNNVISVVNKEFEYENEFAECTAMVDENF